MSEFARPDEVDFEIGGDLSLTWRNEGLYIHLAINPDGWAHLYYDIPALSTPKWEGVGRLSHVAKPLADALSATL